MNNDLQKVNDALKEFLSNAKQKNASQDRAAFVGEVSRNVMDIFAPVLQEMANNSKINKDELAAVLREIQVAAPEVKMPEIRIPEVNVPTPQVTVNVPKAEAPRVTVQPTPVNFPDSMRLTPNEKPFPVIMMDQGGKPMVFPVSGGSSGPGFPMQTLDTDNNAIRVSGSFSVTASNSSTQAIDSSGTPYSQANPFPVVFGSSGTTGSALVDSSGVQYSGSNPLPTTASLSLASGQGDEATATRVVQAGNSASSVVVNSGTITTVTTLTGITNSVAVVTLDRDGNPLTTGPIGNGDEATALRVVLAGNSASSVIVNSGTITTVTTLTGITNTIAVANIDSSGVQYSGQNPMPVTLANTGSTQNVTVAGVTDSAFVYQARTTNPTAVSDGADVRPKADKLGRQITRPIHARDLIATAYVTLSTGTEATLLAAAAGQYIDLISIIAANTSTVAQQLDIRATTAGNIVQTLWIPANATAGWTPPVPWPQDSTGNTWTVDMADYTNSNILISALFSKEI